MEKQTKNVVTRESIEKDIRFANSAGIRSALVLFLGTALLFFPFAIPRQAKKIDMLFAAKTYEYREN